MYTDNLAYRLLKYCEDTGLTYAELAHRCNISERHLGNIIRRHSIPSIAVLERIAAATDLQPNDLLLPPYQKPNTH